MWKSLLKTATAVCGILVGSAASGQDYTAMNEAFNAQLNAQMQATSNQFVNTNMNNPYIRQQWQQYRAHGGQLNFQSYCFRWAETGGYTWEGTRRAINTSNAIHASDSERYQQYVDSSRQTQQQTWDYRNRVQDSWANQRGENLTAQATFTNTVDGSSWTLPTNISSGQTVFDRNTGYAFTVDVNGQYWMHNGQYWQALQHRK